MQSRTYPNLLTLKVYFHRSLDAIVLCYHCLLSTYKSSIKPQAIGQKSDCRLHSTGVLNLRKATQNSQVDQAGVIMLPRLSPPAGTPHTVAI